MALRIALDSNRYTDLAKGERKVQRVVEEAEMVFLPFVTLAELRAGFTVGNRGRENERLLRRFLVMPGVEVLYAGDSTTRHYASLYRHLRRQGTPIPTNDIWIAAIVLEHNLTLYSRDRHFEHLPQIAVL